MRPLEPIVPLPELWGFRSPVRSALGKALLAAGILVFVGSPALRGLNAAPPDEFIVSGGKVFPISSAEIDGGAVWVKEGKIYQVGKIEVQPGDRES